MEMVNIEMFFTWVEKSVDGTHTKSSCVCFRFLFF